MAMFNQKRLKDLAVLSVAVMLVQIALTKWIYPLFGSSTQQLFSITPQTAIGSQTVGTKILAGLSGILPWDFTTITNWIVLFLGVFVLLIAGYWVYNQKWAWKGKNIYQRLWAILLYGTVALYAVLLVTNIAAVATLAVPLAIGVAVNYLAIAIVIATAARYFKILSI